MTKISVETLAKQLDLPANVLLEQFKAANMRVNNVDQEISKNQKDKIEAFLKEHSVVLEDAEPKVEEMLKSPKEKQTEPSVRGDEKSLSKPMGTISLKASQSRPDKVVLKRTTKSTLQVTGAQNRSPKTVNVEVRKKRTYVKRSVLEQEKLREKEQKRLEAEQVVTGQPERLRKTEEIITEPKIAEEPVVKSTVETVAEPLEQVLGIDRSVVLANLEREKRQHLKELEQEKEDLKAKKRTKARQVEKEQRGRKKIDVRSIDLTGGGEDEISIVSAERQHKKVVQCIDSSALRIKKQVFEKPVEPLIREVVIPEAISVSDLAQKMAVKATEVVKTLMSLGVMATVNQIIDRDTAVIVVETMGHKPKIMNENVLEESLMEDLKSDAELVSRAPVVTIMGHVDHGKTKLLDCIRRTKIAEGEAGGITQHIGAYHVKTEKGVVTFLDTPGHEAFTAMRARGVKITDIVVLVVAADDGVMPQTVEAIQHAKAAEVPIVVAVNKIDKPEADPERIRSELSQHEVISEEWGGDTIFVDISAKQAVGIDELLNAILLQAEMLELKAVKDTPAKGAVIESRLDVKRGPIATVLVQEGTLHVGDVMLAGLQFGHIRVMQDEFGNRITEAGPAIPAEVLGLSGTPMAGDTFFVTSSERKAREVALFRREKYRDIVRAAESPVTLSNLFENINQNKISVLNIVLKTDVQGSLEALRESLLRISTDEVQVKIVSSGVGAITESDVNLAVASRAIIIGFNVRSDLPAKRLIESTGVDVRYHNIIYNVINEVKSALSGMLAPEIKEKTIGLAEVREVFRSSRFGTIAGCMVIDGIIKRNKPVRVLRNHVIIYEGDIDSLRRFKEDVSEVRQNTECGIGIKNYNDIQVGDQIEVFDRIEVERKL
jgi:translation initiation factor IF-2